MIVLSIIDKDIAQFEAKAYIYESSKYISPIPHDVIAELGLEHGDILEVIIRKVSKR